MEKAASGKDLAEDAQSQAKVRWAENLYQGEDPIPEERKYYGSNQGDFQILQVYEEALK